MRATLHATAGARTGPAGRHWTLDGGNGAQLATASASCALTSRGHRALDEVPHTVCLPRRPTQLVEVRGVQQLVPQVMLCCRLQHAEHAVHGIDAATPCIPNVTCRRPNPRLDSERLHFVHLP